MTPPPRGLCGWGQVGTSAFKYHQDWKGAQRQSPSKQPSALSRVSFLCCISFFPKKQQEHRERKPAFSVLCRVLCKQNKTQTKQTAWLLGECQAQCGKSEELRVQRDRARGGERGSTAAVPLARVAQYLDGTGKSSTHKWKSLKAGTGETGRRWARNLTRVWRKRVLPELCGLLGRAWWVSQRSFLHSGARCGGAAVFHVAEKRTGVCAAPKWEPGTRNRKEEPVEVCVIQRRVAQGKGQCATLLRGLFFFMVKRLQQSIFLSIRFFSSPLTTPPQWSLYDGFVYGEKKLREKNASLH